MNTDILSKDIREIQTSLNIMVSKLEKKIHKKNISILCTKIELLHESFKSIYNDIDDIIYKLDTGDVWSLSKEDMDRLRSNQEAEKIKNVFLPYMLYYKVVSDIINT